MPLELNREAYQKLIDEDLEWLASQPRTLEREHIEVCLRWLRENKPTKQELFLILYDDSGLGDWVFHGCLGDDANGRAAIKRITSRGVGYQVVRGNRITHVRPRDDDEGPNYSPDPEDFM